MRLGEWRRLEKEQRERKRRNALAPSYYVGRPEGHGPDNYNRDDIEPGSPRIRPIRERKR